ncbi:MAG: phosphoethanolamine--lipid A transferase [Desulfobulbus sp.]|nr:phosphoethanolamine--lipid A transferase [Desulfobulbus sp.]
MFNRTPRTKTRWVLKSQWLIVLLTLYFGFALNLSFWRFINANLEITNGRMALFAVSLLIVSFILFAWFLSLVVIKPVTKYIVLPFLLISSATNYLMYTLGVFIDADMIRNVVQTNLHEAVNLITLNGCAWVLFTGIIPALVLARVRIQYQPFKKELATRLLFVAISLAVVGGFAASSYKEYVAFFRNHNVVRKLLNTINYTYGIMCYFKEEAEARRSFVWLDQHAHSMPYPDAEKTALIFILGEAARAKNFSLQGYEREDNPLLTQQDIVYFSNMHSCGTATAISVPCMFSPTGSKGFNATDAKFTQNLLDLLTAGGYDIFWQENDQGCKGVCERVPSEDMVKSNNPLYCTSGYCLDEALLEGLEGKLRGLSKNTVFFLHTMGSHGPTYYQRYPERFKKFTPTCDTADIQNCPREAIVNTYDNTIVYTDYIISSVIDIAAKFPDLEIGVIYVSDHGESLGENNIYLHALPYAIAPEEQKHIPFVLWMSERMKQNDHINYDCLKNKARTQAFTHDNLFHSLLSLLEVQSTLYQPEKDIFRDCRTKELPF